MPKLKTKKAMKKRYRITSSGKVIAPRSKRRHMMADRSPKSKRQSRRPLQVEAMHCNAIKRCMPYDR
ncbi:MAG TPA: 50S ribosomal protein L35 [Candidatus Omnitrophota bacterium]|nr:50S ribosomal protein L35 [Candidatus Omnitrophota bacterium]HPS37436.1 50S ribosomal protein L35 [Candidatus Omnitrophota bacterium]